MLFNVNDDPLLKSNFDDNLKIEPDWYCPIIPMVLVNGAEGIGTGWSTKLPNYDVREIIANIKRMLDGEDPLPMVIFLKKITSLTWSFIGKIYREIFINDSYFFSFFFSSPWNRWFYTTCIYWYCTYFYCCVGAELQELQGHNRGAEWESVHCEWRGGHYWRPDHWDHRAANQDLDPELQGGCAGGHVTRDRENTLNDHVCLCTSWIQDNRKLLIFIEDCFEKKWSFFLFLKRF